MNILILSPIDPGAIEQLKQSHNVRCEFKTTADELPDLVRDREVLIFRSGVQITGDLMDCAPDLKLLIRAGSGFDNVDLDYVTARGLGFERIPEPGAKAVAELSFALMLGLARDLRTADQQLRRGHWCKHEIEAFLLTGKTLGVVGAGNIGSRLGRMGAAWGMDVIGCVAHPTVAEEKRLAVSNIQMKGFDEVLRRADFLSLHVPLNESTRGFIGPHELNMMKPGAFLVNLARGGVVEEAALYASLTRADGLRGAGLDVHEREGNGKISPLAGLPNVLLTPHVGASTVDSQREIGERVIEILELIEPQIESTEPSAAATAS